MLSEDWVETECPMLNEEFRKKHINLIQAENRVYRTKNNLNRQVAVIGHRSEGRVWVLM